MVANQVRGVPSEVYFVPGHWLTVTSYMVEEVKSSWLGCMYYIALDKNTTKNYVNAHILYIKQHLYKRTLTVTFRHVLAIEGICSIILSTCGGLPTFSTLRFHSIYIAPVEEFVGVEAVVWLVHDRHVL